LTPDELTTFLSKVDKDFIPYFVLNAFTVLRGDEIKRLDWSEVKLERSLIDLPFEKSKNGKRKPIEVPDNLKEWLSPYVKESGSIMPRKKLQLAFEKAAKDSNLHPWRQNCLRHSFCSYAVVENGAEVGYACRCAMYLGGVKYETLQVSTEEFRTNYINKRNTGKSNHTDF
jgi:integrase